MQQVVLPLPTSFQAAHNIVHEIFGQSPSYIPLSKILWHAIKDARITAEEPAGPISEAASKELSETTHAVPSLMPSTGSVQLSSGRMHLSSRMVGYALKSFLVDELQAASFRKAVIWTNSWRKKGVFHPDTLVFLWTEKNCSRKNLGHSRSVACDTDGRADCFVPFLFCELSSNHTV
ncbi:hypothetical protein FRACYDRAFT_231825 [Fragilariopsis cylindrus CCMP1102]|uniref:Uncharacterized protein n=1 Tax=Fragilariopsis cylindrus CCMP1102 TaxID=635003 RepID=A0A1E7FV24_9STRA|nr:hypothetical protein FRACYDRAFT_231825 [Fragilariopsis cylindrus CCMP1102]|eukprot:OEU21683.1 hypothetical protein FRACYDRAFT_231825 [Fragilariopsis cylindrus CCMP1102]